MSPTTYACYDQMVASEWSRAHVLAAMPTAINVSTGVKRHFIDATAHRRVPEVLPT